MAYQEQAAPLEIPAAAGAGPRRAPLWATVLKFIRRKPLGAMGFGMVGLLLVLATGAPTGEVGIPSLPHRPLGFELGAPFLQRYDPEAQFYTIEGRVSRFEAPSADNWFGTDGHGRDVWARIVNGTRRSMAVGLWALSVATVFGAAIGIFSGYFGRWVDTISQRFMDALQSFPPLVALILILAINPLGSGDTISLFMLSFALGLVGIPSVQRIARGVVLSTREQQYVEAARVIGATDLRIMLRYILPNIMASIIVVFSTGIGVVILAEAALSFIAADKVPTGISWGMMLAESYNIIGNNPWPAIFSAAAITFAVLAFNLAGDALRDVLDPRLRM
jgi:ABC-type dipeptide/oligopeptide/nickel transport system permease subunit